MSNYVESRLQEKKEKGEVLEMTANETGDGHEDKNYKAIAFDGRTCSAIDRLPLVCRKIKTARELYFIDLTISFPAFLDMVVHKDHEHIDKVHVSRVLFTDVSGCILPKRNFAITMKEVVFEDCDRENMAKILGLWETWHPGQQGIKMSMFFNPTEWFGGM